jgi:predicted CxxxxCH...CXXCH cytochrome family protein
MCGLATLPRMRGWWIAAIACASAIGCSTSEPAEPAPTYRDRIGPLLAETCAPCHRGATAAGGFRATSYVEVIGCLPDGRSAVNGDDPPMLRALATPSHAAVAGARDVLARWLKEGAKASGTGVHPPEFLDPRSNASHARVLAARRYAQMLDENDADACGACHVGSPNHAPGMLGADRATACTSCHAGAEGPLSCTTCHGDEAMGRAYPPRAACFHPEAKADTAHAAHLAKGELHAQSFECKACHPQPADGRPTVTHADGYVEVWGVGFDPKSRACTNACHARKDGATPNPAWNGPKMACDGCHGAPPKDHAKGPCTPCHHEANADGTGLLATALHVDGKVDLGDGSGRCGACHGKGDDPLPTTGAHAKHAAPAGAPAVACGTCHALPVAGEKHPKGGGSATVTLTGLATKTGLAAKFDPATKSCSAVYCHAAVGGGTAPAPTWTQGASASACGACHGLPPPAPHTSSGACGAGICHAGSVSGGTLTPEGVAKHVNGSVDP